MTNIYLIGAIFILLWLGIFALYLHASREMDRLTKEIEEVKQQLDAAQKHQPQ